MNQKRLNIWRIMQGKKIWHIFCHGCVAKVINYSVSNIRIEDMLSCRPSFEYVDCIFGSFDTNNMKKEIFFVVVTQMLLVNSPFKSFIAEWI